MPTIQNSFLIGDKVLVLNEETAIWESGKIVEYLKDGWYEIKTDNDSVYAHNSIIELREE